MIVKRLRLIAIALIAAMLLGGCNLIRTDPAYLAQLEAEKAAAEQAAYEADMATVLATYRDFSSQAGEDGRGKVTKGEVIDEYNAQASMNYVYMSYMYSTYFGSAYNPTAEDLNDQKNRSIEAVAQRKVLISKMLELGYDDFTDEEYAEMREQAHQEYADYEQYFRLMGTESAMVQTLLMIEGITEETLYADEFNSRLKERLSGVVNADTQVTEEEIRAKYDELVEAARTKYTESPVELETAAQMGETVYYMPEGFKYVKHVFLRPEDDDIMANLNAVRGEVEALEGEIAALQTQLEAAANATPAEATADEAEIPLDQQLADKKRELAEKTTEREAAVQAAWDSVRAELDGVLNAIESGESFDALIEQYGDDLGSSMDAVKEKGYLVYENSENWDPAFLEAAKSLENAGDIAEPVLGNMGVHVIKYESSPATGVAAYEDVHELAAEDALESKRDSILEEATAKWFEEADIVYSYDAWVIK